MDPFEYDVNLHWVAGRKGEISSPALQDKIEIATPPEFQGGIPNIWSPEHLFTASVLSCFMTTFLAIAENSKLNFKDFNCSAKGYLEKVDGKFMMSRIVLNPDLKILMEEDRPKAEKILEKSEKACLISNSITSQVDLNTNVQVLLAVN